MPHFRTPDLSTWFRSSSRPQGRPVSRQMRAILAGVVCCVALGCLPALAQNVQYTNKLADKTKRSGFRVDPSTLGLNVEITIADYPGRAGAGLPIALNYSSKLWRMRFVQAGDGTGGNTYGTWVAPTWGEHTAAGWISTLGVPTFIDDTQEFYDSTGLPAANCAGGCWVVRKVTVQMPDGSSHVLRHTSPTAQATASPSGTYYASDGSGLRYEYDAKTLYLPDGSRYVLGSVSWPATTTTYTDRNGNTLSYDPATNLWTDTLGRTFAPPPMPGTPGDYPYSVRGVGNTAMTYTFRWRRLADALTTSQPLANPGDCSGILLSNPPVGPYLFQSLGADSACEESPSSVFNPAVLAEIVLPDNTSYKFTYNVYGEIDKVVYPTGGYERFVYEAVQPIDYVFGVYAETNRGVVEHYVSPSGSGSDEAHWHYSAGRPNWDYAQPYKVTITAPDNTYTERHLHAATASTAGAPWGFNDVRVGRAYDERVFSPTNQMLRRALTQWDASPQGTYPDARDARVGKQVEVVLDTGTANAQTKTTDYQYDSDLNVVRTNQYDFYQVPLSTGQGGAIPSIPAGTLLRTDETTYLVNDPAVDSNTRAAYRGRNHIRLASSSLVRDGGGTVRAQSELKYDESGYPLLPNGAAAGWADPQTTVRGNATTVRRWLDTANAWVETHAQYDLLGNLRKTWDANGNLSQLTYSDSFSDGAQRNTYAFPTTATSAVPDPSGVYGSPSALTTSTVYDYSTGLVTSTTDANGKTTSLSYADDAGNVDPLDRLMRVTRPDGGWTKYDYGRNQWGDYVHTRVLQDSSGRETSSYGYTDGLGRAYRSFLYENQDASKPWLTTDTEYDVLGRVSRVSQPYRSTGSAQAMFSGGRWTETSYDALARVTAVTTRPDGAAVTSVYAGQYVTVTDQAGKVRRSKTDALGRLVRVDEPDAVGSLGEADAPAQPTYYTYDVMGNLRRVEQGGQQRSFMYDSLSRLIRAKNPEQAANGGLVLADPVTGNSQWSTAYGYDANGNLATRVDARGVTTTYGYDALNRPTTVRYSDGTKDVDRHYDSATNGRGRFWYFNWDPANNARFDTHLAVDEYDAAGRTIKYRQHFLTNGVASPQFLVTLGYNLAGAVTSETYPSGHMVSYSYDAAGRLSGFSGNLGDGAQRAYSSEVLYDERGGMSQERFGTDTPLYHKQLYNSRGQLAEIRVGLYPVTDPDPDRATGWQRGAIINHYGNTGWGAGSGGQQNNGNLRAQDVFIPNDDAAGYEGRSTVIGQTYGYDSLNRLTSAAESGGASWSQGYAYDRWGNRTVSGQNAPAPQYGVEAGTNRLVAPSGYTMGYDAAGNLTYDNYTGAGVRSYDAESRMVSAQTGASQSASYAYDADGRRVKRLAGTAGEVWQVYGLGGELLAEYAKDASPASARKEYGYRGGELLVTAEASPAGWGAPPSFSDEALAGKLVLSLYVVELRRAIDAVRSHKGLPAYGWQAAAGSGDPITAESFLELRRALDSALGEPAGGYAAGLAVGQPIRAVFLEELRRRVLDAWQGGSAGVDVRWLVSDQLGTPRMAVDRTGSLAGVTRHDYLPFGEEIMAGTGGRTASQGYSHPDGTRNRFTGKERDDETGLDYFIARYYSAQAGRFTTPDPLLTSGTIDDPQTWNRYAYTSNNPLKYTDPFGLYRYSDDLGGSETKKDLLRDIATGKRTAKEVIKIEKGRKMIDTALEQARAAANDPSLNAYQSAQLQRATDSFGTFNDGRHDNVVVGLSKPDGDAGTQLGKDGNTIFVDLNFGNANRDPVVTIAHEGSHVADYQDYINHAGKSDVASYDITLWQGERRAYFVSSYMAQALGKDLYYPKSPSGMSEKEVWNKGWKEQEREVKRMIGVFKATGWKASNPGRPLSKLDRR